ncbi:MAG TPA: hypothetical protein VMY99_03910 [Nevskiaceae bacterium]|nr:hypothetical protein [Nevskiaceae bacterium]
MKDDHIVILLNRIEDKLQRFAEAMGDVPAKITKVEERLDTIENNVKAIKGIARMHSKELDGHEERLTTLETA